MLKLKHYQEECLEVLKEYLEEASLLGAREAFARVTRKHPSDIRQSGYRVRWELENVPYVCLRLPTGGGKTLLATHSVSIATNSFLNREKPLVLWLVPTNTMRKQTVQALKQSSPPYREALDAAFGAQGVSVFDVEDINDIRPEDLFRTCCIIVATMQTFRVADSNKDARKIYGENENFEQHFRSLSNTDPKLDKSDSGAVLHSFVNLVHQLYPFDDSGRGAQDDIPALRRSGQAHQSRLRFGVHGNARGEQCALPGLPVQAEGRGDDQAPL